MSPTDAWSSSTILIEFCKRRDLIYTLHIRTLECLTDVSPRSLLSRIFSTLEFFIQTPPPPPPPPSFNY